jgi:cytidine diphosphoramidate kinase
MIKIIWITGISGTGKSTLAKYYLKFLKNFLWIDGDKFRKLFNNDLGYTLSDRNRNAERLINFVEFIEKQNLHIIVSANLTSNKYQRLIKKKFKNLVHIKILTELNILKKRDKKNIYIKNKNVVGKDISIENNNKLSDFEIYNNSSKLFFLLSGKKILKKLKIKKTNIKIS